MSSVLLTVVIPAFNESKRIGGTLDLLYRELESLNAEFEVIVVDDGSSDGTAGLIKNTPKRNLRVLSNDRNRGKGYSVYRGFRDARGNNILLMDADGSTDLKSLKPFLQILEENKADAVIGSRAVADSVISVPQPISRRIMGVCFRVWIKALFLFPWNDTQCGFKMLKSSAAKSILTKCREDGFAFDVEMLYWLKKFIYKIVEKGVTWNNDEDSKVTLLKGPIKMFFAILRLRVITLFE